MNSSAPLIVAIASQMLLIFPLLMLVLQQINRLKTLRGNLEAAQKAVQDTRKELENEQKKAKELEHDCAELKRKLTERPASLELDEFLEDVYRYNKAILQVKPIHVEEVLLRARPPR